MSDGNLDRDAEIAKLRRENESLKERFSSLQHVYHGNGQEYRDEIGILRENARFLIGKLEDVLGATGRKPGEARTSVNITGAVEHAVLNCPHEETDDTIVLKYDPAQRGATVGSQLIGRISDALGTRHDSLGIRHPEDRRDTESTPSSDAWLACNPSGIERKDIIDLLREFALWNPLNHPNWASLQEKARKLAQSLEVMPKIQTDEDTSRAASRLLQQVSTVSPRDLSQHDRDVRTLIEATWQRGTDAEYRAHFADNAKFKAAQEELHAILDLGDGRKED